MIRVVRFGRINIDSCTHRHLGVASCGRWMARNRGRKRSKEIWAPLPFGVVVTSVLPTSPPVASGIKVGDLVVAINDDPVKDQPAYVRMVNDLEPDKQATITRYTKGDKNFVSLTFWVAAVPDDERKRQREACVADIWKGGYLPGFTSIGSLICRFRY